MVFGWLVVSVELSSKNNDLVSYYQTIHSTLSNLFEWIGLNSNSLSNISDA